MIARLGGDEFVVLLEDISQPEYAAKVADSLIACIELPWTLSNGSEVYIGTSIGISLFPDHGSNALDLLKHADAAMYQAKASGRGVARYYSENLTQQARRRFTLEAKLRDAISRNELQLHYQPKFDVFTGNILGAEALVRWVDDEGLMILPNEFISIAEETGLINKLGEWVLNEACKQGKVWKDKGLDMAIAVNLSATQLYHSNIAKTISDILQTTGFPARNLELELTESILMRRESESIKTLYQIKNLGITLAVDDFGAGYSSLAYLRRFPLDVLKIDRSFIADLEDDKDDRAITATIIAIGRTLNLQVIAEGVETSSQLAFLASHGCHMYQGFFASQALEPAKFEAFIKQYQGNNVFSKMQTLI
jgi:predicted signal transduction protein with EAL and GGDEF domain